MGLPAIEALQVVERIDAVELTEERLKKRFLCGSVVEHCVSSAKGCGFDSQGTHILMKMYNLNANCKSLWIKASAININTFPKVFTGLGKLEGNYCICLKADAVPYALTTPRRVPIPLENKIKEELDRMERLGVISRIEQPTDWCAGMVPVVKANGKLRLSVVLTKLNESVCRERHILPSVEQSLWIWGSMQAAFEKIKSDLASTQV